MSEVPSNDPRATGDAVRPEAVGPEEEREQPVVRDKRRIDPVTGRLREPAAPAGATSPPADPAGQAAGDAAAEDAPAGGEDPRVAELTDQLQRLSAEYANYRRRKEREQAELVERVTGDVLGRLISVLDDVERARAHGDLEGAFRSVGEALEKVTTTLGLVAYGQPGEPFDPKVHDALVSQPSPDATEATVAEVYARGYRLGERVLRAAQVVVAEPA
ncbi:MAG: nucleotide exchange factor GrpE [Actinomycetota bacterium]|nr:nucleotide exchange factor GrpE [Actinomycetota bacterium]